MRTFVLFVAVLILVAACGGGSAGSNTDPSGIPTASSVSTTPPASSPTPTTQSCPSGDTGTYPDCVAPGPTATPTPPPPPATLPACQVGTTPSAATTCQCPPAYLNANTGACIVPAPAVPPPTDPAPAMSLSASPNPVTAGSASVLTWNSTGATTCYGSAGWPTSDQLTPSGFVTAPPLTAPTSYTLICAGPGGTAEASVTVGVATPAPPPSGPPAPPTCALPDLPIGGGTCQAPPTVSLTLSIDPTTVADGSAGCPSPSGQACLATVTITSASTLTGDTVECYDGSGGWINPASGYSVGPYVALQDGPQVITVSCRDVWSSAATASITLEVVAPGPPPGDTFTGVYGGNFETLTWDSHSTDGCYVEQFNDQGVGVALIPGGGTSGSATSGFLSPSYEPYSFVLYCGGAPDTNVPSITVNP
jgi:hypothetical protein